MCGILGRYKKYERKENGISIIRNMGEAQSHRGPDSWGEWSNGEVSFGHNRLAILDIEYGSQPMCLLNDEYVIVYNGEVYNYLEIKDELIKKGYSFNTKNSDTEVILIGYREWGKELFKKLNGMFSIAIWDKQKNEIVLSRDRIGIKPLYYHVSDNLLIFASELKTIINSSDIKPKLDKGSMVEYFRFKSSLNENTLFKEIKRLLPGTYMVYDINSNKFIIQEYIESDLNILKNNYEIENQVNKLDKLIRKSIEMHMISDVPVGVFLSGGVDSSIIASIAKEYNSKIQAYTIKTNSEWDESSYAVSVAKKIGLDINIVEVLGNDYLNALEEWIRVNDDLVGDVAALSLILLSKAAKKDGFKVMLAGEGADELFGGYKAYNTFYKVKCLEKNTVLKNTAKIIGKNFFSGIKKDYLISINNSKFFGTPICATLDQLNNIFLNKSNDLFDEIKYYKLLEPGREAMINDQKNGLVNVLLNRADRATMSQGIEARVPFLENDIIEFANSLPDKFCFGNEYKENKLILKKVAEKYIDKEIIYRKKIGFRVPIEQWLREDFKLKIEGYLDDKKISDLNYKYIKKLYNSHLLGKNENTSIIWSWIMLEEWYRKYI